MRTKLIGAVLVGLLVIALAGGCGSSKKKAASSNTTNTTTTQVTTGQTTTSTSTTGGLNLTSKDCQNLIAAEQTIAKAEAGNVPSDINTQIAALKALAKNAPKSVQADMNLLLSASEAVISAGIKPGQKATAAQTAKLVQAMSKMDLTKLSKAATELGTWAETVCTPK